ERYCCWDLSSVPFRELASVDDPDVPWTRTHSPDGQWLKDDLTMMSYSATTLEPQSTLAGFDEPLNLKPMAGGMNPLENAFAPDSKTLAGWGPLRPPGMIARFLGKSEWTRKMTLWEIPSGRQLALFKDSTAYAYFPDGKSLATWAKEGTIAIWDIPPRRPWWIDYGLPILFTLLMLLGIWHCIRFRRKTPAALDVAPTS